MARHSMPCMDCDVHPFGSWLPLTHPTSLLYWEPWCFERTFYLPVLLPLPARRTLFYQPQLSSPISATQIVSMFTTQDSRSLISLLEGVCAPPDTHHFPQSFLVLLLTSCLTFCCRGIVCFNAVFVSGFKTLWVQINSCLTHLCFCPLSL